MQKSILYIKSALLSFLLFAETALLVYFLILFVKNQNFFSPQLGIISGVSVMMLMLSYTITLTIGAWDKWEQFLIVTAPISLGVLITIFTINTLYGIILAIVTALLIAHGIHLSTSVHKILIKFVPGLVMRSTLKSLYFAIAIVAAGLMLLNPTDEDLNIGKKIGEFAQNQVSSIAKEDPSLQMAAEQGIINLNIEEEVINTVKNFIDPYRHLIAPLMATLVFAAVEGLGALVYLVFSISSKPLVWFFKKIGFLTVETKTVDQEILKF